MSPLAAALDSIRTLLQERGLHIEPGVPEGEADLMILPWQLATEHRLQSNMPGHPQPEDAEGGRLPLILRFLLICRDPVQGADKLALAHALLSSSPVIHVEGANCRLLSETLSPGDLAALFTAAGIPLSLSSAFVLHVDG